MQNEPRFPAWLKAAYESCPDAIPRALQWETVAVEDACMRVTSEPVRACEDVPPWAIAACAGYAFRKQDTNTVGGSRPSTLRMNHELRRPDRRIDDPWVGPLEPGTAIEMHAYGPLPANVDTVVPIDIFAARDAHRHNRVLLRRSLSRDANVIRKASEYSVGDVLLQKGQRITPERQAVLITAGVREVRVSKRPRIAVVVSSYERCAAFSSRRGWQTIFRVNRTADSSWRASWSSSASLFPSRPG